MILPRVQLLAVLFIAACAHPAQADILIGVARPLQGARAAIGTEIHRAADLAARQINDEGGALSQHVGVVDADDGCSFDGGVKAAQALVARGVALVIGHPCASAATAAAPVYAQAGIVFIASVTRYPPLTDKRAGATIFRLAGRDDRQGAEAGAYLARTVSGRPVAVISDGTRYASQIADAALAVLKKPGAPEVVAAKITGGQKDYAGVIDKLRAAGTQALFFAGYPLEAGLLVRQMRQAGLDTTFLGNDALAPPQFAETAGEAASGAKVLVPYDPARAVMDEKSRKRLEASVRPLSGAFVAAYAAIEIWRAAVRQAQSPAGASAVLQSGSFDCVLGTVAFSPSGDADVPSYAILTWDGDRWQPGD